MLKTTNFSVMNFENAIRGARNPMNSWHKSDSYYDESNNFILGDNDLELASRLCKSGSDHRKFIRQIFVSVDIEAPLYWWKEYDTYKVGTVANSTSTMHKVHSKPFSIEDFSTDELSEKGFENFKNIIASLEEYRLKFIETKNKSYWWDIIQTLPSSYNQLRTCTLNYETLINIYNARKNHKLTEWSLFCEWIESLPYSKELIIF